MIDPPPPRNQGSIRFVRRRRLLALTLTPPPRRSRAIPQVVEANMVPDFILRRGIRYLLKTKCIKKFENTEDEVNAELKFVEDLRRRPVAEQTSAANEQHYEVPTEFYHLCLGSNLKYSCCYYERGNETLDEAELCMFSQYARRAQLWNRLNILELGCGWGSLSLWMAATFPNSKITAVSNSKTQKEFIDAQAKERGIKNLTVITADMVSFEAPEAGEYDRIVSIEMFEHMKNYDILFERCTKWLKPGGLMFIHIFVHRSRPYHFEAVDEDDWMSTHFFTGGTMPSDRLLCFFAKELHFKTQWRVNGNHYYRTCNDWLKKLDSNYAKAEPILEATYGKENKTKWYVYWRLFFLSCAEMFNYDNGNGIGNEWYVSHYLFQKPDPNPKSKYPAPPIDPYLPGPGRVRPPGVQ
jgi:cyclopropane fatty-acyl-phospholipid synthase-like methyltransferase